LIVFLIFVALKNGLETERADVGTDDYVISCRGRVNQIVYPQSHILAVFSHSIPFILHYDVQPSVVIAQPLTETSHELRFMYPSQLRRTIFNAACPSRIYLLKVKVTL
jgi:hypothetical protein